MIAEYGAFCTDIGTDIGADSVGDPSSRCRYRESIVDGLSQASSGGPDSDGGV